MVGPGISICQLRRDTQFYIGMASGGATKYLGIGFRTVAGIHTVIDYHRDCRGQWNNITIAYNGEALEQSFADYRRRHESTQGDSPQSR